MDKPGSKICQLFSRLCTCSFVCCCFSSRHFLRRVLCSFVSFKKLRWNVPVPHTQQTSNLPLLQSPVEATFQQVRPRQGSFSIRVLGICLLSVLIKSYDRFDDCVWSVKTRLLDTGQTQKKTVLILLGHISMINHRHAAAAWPTRNPVLSPDLHRPRWH